MKVVNNYFSFLKKHWVLLALICVFVFIFDFLADRKKGDPDKATEFIRTVPEVLEVTGDINKIVLMKWWWMDRSNQYPNSFNRYLFVVDGQKQDAYVTVEIDDLLLKEEKPKHSLKKIELIRR